MCILVVLRNRVRGWPLVVGANRDEFRDRPWEGPRPDGDLLAPRDLRAGGTWLAVHRAGLLVALTNLPDPDPDPERPSRGLLALEMARSGTPDGAREVFSDETARRRRNAFQVFAGSAADAWVGVHPGEATPLPDGLHTLTNLCRLDELDHRGALDPLEVPPGTALEDVLPALRAALATHADRGPEGRHEICKHGEDRGTLSSSIVAIPGEGPPRLWFAPGAPCEAEFHEVAWQPTPSGPPGT
jgi:hypothetical protein